jgi:ribosome-associated protein
MAIRKKSGGSKGGGKKRVSYKGNKKKKKTKKIHAPSGRSKLRRDRPKKGPAENAAALALAQEIAHTVLEKKASDVVVLDVRGMASYADYLVLASAESERQVAAMADAVSQVLKPRGVRPVSTEGQEGGSWVLLDYADVVAHLFQEDSRAFYDLEGLWSDAKRVAVA